MRSGPGGQRPLVLGPVAAHLLAGEFKLSGDGVHCDVLPPRVKDRAAKGESPRSDLIAGRTVGVSGCNDICHRVRHLSIMTPATWLWPLPMMPDKRLKRNCHVGSCHCHMLCGMI